MGHFLFFLKRQIPLRVPMAGRCHVGQQAVAGCQRVQLQVLRNAAVMQDQCAVQKMLHILKWVESSSVSPPVSVALISLMKSRRVKGSLPKNGSSIR